MPKWHTLQKSFARHFRSHPKTGFIPRLALSRGQIKVACMPDKTNPMPKALKLAEGAQGEPLETNLQRRKVVVIGRGVECDIVIKDVKASRRHCQLTRGDAAFILEDLGAKNGTYVEGKRINEPVALKPNQAFKVGDTIFYLS